MEELFNIFIPHSKVLYSFIGIFWAILFLQSGLDKIFDWKGNLGWLKGHFEKSPLKSVVAPMLGTLTIVELIAGACSAFGVVHLLFTGYKNWIVIGLVFSFVSLLMLFFGQRIAKDYPGAQTIAIYFGIALLSALALQ